MHKKKKKIKKKFNFCCMEFNTQLGKEVYTTDLYLKKEENNKLFNNIIGYQPDYDNNSEFDPTDDKNNCIQINKVNSENYDKYTEKVLKRIKTKPTQRIYYEHERLEKSKVNKKGQNVYEIKNVKEIKCHHICSDPKEDHLLNNFFKIISFPLEHRKNYILFIQTKQI